MNWWITALENLATGALGGLATVYGLSRWLGTVWLEKQKAKYSQELEQFKDQLLKEQKRIQAGIDSSVFVTRAHFETEFSAMKDIFKALAEVKMALASFRNYNAADRARAQGIIENFQANLERLEAGDKTLLSRMEELGAFYLPDLYDEVNRCHIATEFEVTRLRNLVIGEIRDRLMTDEGIANHNEFGRHYSQASQIIRNRLTKLAVLPGSR